MFHAVEKGHVLIVKELLDAGANTEAQNKVCIRAPAVEFKMATFCLRNTHFTYLKEIFSRERMCCSFAMSEYISLDSVSARLAAFRNLI